MNWNISGAGGASTMGADLVSKTLDTMNGVSGGDSYAPTDKQTFGAAVVSKTLDYMNSGSGGNMGSEMSQTYDFSKNVLSGYMAGKGTLADYNI